MSEGRCYHCGLPIPSGLQLSVQIDGQARAMCCIGCQAVAQAIVDGGLGAYYTSRDALPGSPREALPPVLGELARYDHADFQKGFVRALGEHEREASLILEGITCSACLWLNEQHVARQPGVTGVEINFATHRARVRWDSRQIRFSDILAAIAAIGYRAHPYDAARHESLARQERRRALWRLFVAGFGMMQVMMYAVPVYLAGEGDMTPDIESLMRWASLALTVPVMGYSAVPFFRGAWRDLRGRRAGMDVPVALGIGAAFVASVWATLTGAGEVYFDSVTMFVFFLLGGRYLEMSARQRAVGVTETLARLQPAVAVRVTAYPDDRSVTAVSAAELCPGDVVLVRPGEMFPADGSVIEGESCADEALLTGESAPVVKAVGAAVTGGAVNVDSPLFVRVDAVGEATRLSAILRLMERAASEKPALLVLADRVAAHFIVALLVLAAVVGWGWVLVDPSKALWITVSVLVVSCPCALSLATPVALTAASGAMARAGLLVARGHAIETLAQVTHFVFDKTGTLTTGRMTVREVIPLGALGAADCLALAAALEQASEHPIAVAFRQAVGAAALPVPDDVMRAAGEGVGARCAGRVVRLGRPDFVAAMHGQPLPAHGLAAAAPGETLVALGDAEGWLALFCLGDDIRPEAAAMVRGLRAAGCGVSLLSGDALPVARHVAQQVGIELVEAGVSPQGKQASIERLQRAGAVVAMVGDGVNDAPVLAQAQVSIAMGGGSHLARTQADLLLLSDHPAHLLYGFELARRTRAVIRQNLVWAFAYNVLAIPLAIAGWVTPWMAGIGMSASSLLVVLNSLRLQVSKRS